MFVKMHVVNQSLPVMLRTMMYVMNQQPISNNTDSYNYYLLNIGQEVNSTKCYGIYGCFPLSAPWTSENRPVSLFPEGFDKLNPNYFLYNKDHPIRPIAFDLNDHEMIRTSKIDPNLKLYVVAHGFMDNGDKNWVKQLTTALLDYEDCSVIVVDWASGSGPPYTQAVANIRLVGAITAHLLAALADETRHRSLHHVHAIGHSLGAHLSGYVGYTLKREFNLTLGRITGMDPAEPHFAKAHAPVRLDRSAADFVDIIHTDGSQFIRGGLGMTEKIGHIDFYPNGGTNQPGCDHSVIRYISAENGSFFQGMKKFLGCNHMRSQELFIESITSKCPFMSIACNAYEDFKAGKCFECGKKGQHCIKFGFHSRSYYEKLFKSKAMSKKKTIATYLMTGAQGPYCRAHYRISIKVSDDQESKLHGGEIGQLSIIVFSSSNATGENSHKMSINPGGYHEPGELYTAVVPAHAVSNIGSVQVEWEYNISILNPLTWRLLSTPKIFVESIKIDAMEIGQSVTVCPENKSALVANKPKIMFPRFCT